jgi:hypothetical protein
MQPCRHAASIRMPLRSCSHVLGQAKQAAKIMEPSRLYSHVTWGTRGRWVVQREQKYICSHVDQHEAAKMAAKEFGVTLKSLLLKNATQSPAKHQKSTYQYVVFHARRRVWYAQCREHYLGTFATELAAARAVVHANLATSLQELKKKKRQTDVAGPGSRQRRKPRPRPKLRAGRGPKLRRTPRPRPKLSPRRKINYPRSASRIFGRCTETMMVVLLRLAFQATSRMPSAALVACRSASRPSTSC